MNLALFGRGDVDFALYLPAFARFSRAVIGIAYLSHTKLMIPLLRSSKHTARDDASDSPCDCSIRLWICRYGFHLVSDIALRLEVLSQIVAPCPSGWSTRFFIHLIPASVD